jgi:hypothetical protein
VSYIVMPGAVVAWSYGSWIYNYLCNQCLSPLMLWDRIPIRVRYTTFMICGIKMVWFGLVLWSLTPLSTIFQLYRGGQFSWWSQRKPPTCPSHWQTLSHKWSLMSNIYLIIWHENDATSDNIPHRNDHLMPHIIKNMLYKSFITTPFLFHL